MLPASSRKVAITFRCFLMIPQPEKRETSLLLRTPKRLANRKTTSLPKAVVDTQYSRANMGLQQANDLGYTPEDRVCTAMPVFHCFSLSVNVTATLFTGACLCLPKSRHTGDLLTLIQDERCTVFSTVPALFDAILRREDFEEWDLSSLRTGFIGRSLRKGSSDT